MAKCYLDGDERERRDILDFFESDGPRKVHEARQKHEDGTPTSADLDEWLGRDTYGEDPLGGQFS